MPWGLDEQRDQLSMHLWDALSLARHLRDATYSHELRLVALRIEEAYEWLMMVELPSDTEEKEEKEKC